jgi:ComF family protein
MGFLGDSLRRFLYPPACPRCARATPGDLLCEGCAATVTAASAPPPPPGIDALLAPYRYDGAVRDLLLRLKYGGDRHPLAALASLLVAAVDAQALGRPDAAVPIPATWVRRRRRGFNQAELLARAAADALGIPVLPQALRRNVFSRPQAALSGAARAANLRGAVHPGDGLFGRAVLLVDDVMTTGATLTAAATAARAGGARRIAALVLAVVEA